MRQYAKHIRTRKKILVIFAILILYVLHSTIHIYIDSSYLATLIGESRVGLIFTLASLVTIGAIKLMPRMLRAIGNQRLALYLMGIQFASLSALATSPAPLLGIVLFIINFAAIALTTYTLDIFIQHYSEKGSIGKIRGFMLTMANVGWLFAPLIASFILTDGDYWKIYLSSFILLIPAFILVISYLGDFRDKVFKETPYLRSLRSLWRRKDLLGIYLISFLLNLFFTWMVIYTPLYLHGTIGFEWSEIGVMLSIMLLPFVLLEAPLGRLSDTGLGEKELLSAGFVIMAVATYFLVYLDSPNFLLWTLVLFVSRIGASTVEVMSETYFFKKFGDKDITTLGLFRTIRPFSYLIGPILAWPFFIYFDFKFLFVFLAFLMFYGLRFSLSLHDTK